MVLVKKSRVFVDNENETTEDSIKNPENISKVFSALLTWMKICGIVFIQRNGNPNHKVILHSCYCIIVQIVSLLNGIRYIFAFIDGSSDWQYHIGILSFAWFYICIVYSGVMFLLECKQISTFLTTFEQYQFDYGIHFDIKKTKRHINILSLGLFIESVGVSAAASIFFVIGLIRKTSLYGMNIWPVQNTSGPQYLLAVLLLAIVMIYALNICLGPLIFYFAVLCCIKKEFQHISLKLVRLCQKEPTEISSELETIRQQYQALINLLASVNPILRHVSGGSYALGIPTICFMLYGLAKGQILLEDLYKMVSTIFGNLIGMFAVTFKGASINCEAHKIIDSLQDFDLSVLPEKTINQIAVFSNRVKGPPIGVSVYGLFVIDYSTVLMVFGTIITYAVIAVQFSSDPSVCNILPINTTNVNGTV